MSAVQWSAGQEHALREVAQWHAQCMAERRASRRLSRQIFRVFGFAGVGKTKLAKSFADDVGGDVFYGAFTGKAALQLRKAGCLGASTIHALIYSVKKNPKTGETKFKLNMDCGLDKAALLVIDEVSMVDEELARDLLSFGCPVLVLGDPAQLPPVKGTGFFIAAEPDVMLTEVHRQALDNPIVRMSMDVREGRGLQPGTYGKSRVILRQTADPDELRELVLEADQLICGLNRTRVAFNNRIRSLKGLCGDARRWEPSAGDRVICLKNDREKAIFNGGMWNVDKVTPTTNAFRLLVSSLDEKRAPLHVSVREEFFIGNDKELDWRIKKQTDQFTFGWGITCHKAQGSAWDNVIAFDEGAAFGDASDKWLYTACTRAAEKLTLVL